MVKRETRASVARSVGDKEAEPKKKYATRKGRRIRKSHILSIRIDRGSRARGRDMSGPRFGVNFLKKLYTDSTKRPKADSSLNVCASRLLDEFLDELAVSTAHELNNRGQTTITRSVVASSLTGKNPLFQKLFVAGLKAETAFQKSSI